MKNQIIILVVLLSFTGHVGGQTLNYEVVKGGKSAGHVIAKRSFDGNKEHYEMHTKVEFRLLFTFTVDYFIEEYYQDGVLIEGSGYNTFNERLQNESEIHKTADGYTLKSNRIKHPTSVDEIRYGVAQIYFREPQDDEEIFSQAFGTWLPFEKVGDHVYEMESPDGINEYTYKNGICTQVKMSRDFATFYFIMQPESLAAVENKADSLMMR